MQHQPLSQTSSNDFLLPTEQDRMVLSLLWNNQQQIRLYGNTVSSYNAINPAKNMESTHNLLNYDIQQKSFSKSVNDLSYLNFNGDQDIDMDDNETENSFNSYSVPEVDDDDDDDDVFMDAVESIDDDVYMDSADDYILDENEEEEEEEESEEEEEEDSEEGDGEEYISPEVEVHAANFLQGLQAELGL